MKKTRTTEITVEKSEVFVHKPARLVSVRCAQCVAKARMVTAEEAAAIGHISTRMVYALVEAGQIHFTETADDFLLVCVNSLSKRETNS